MIGLGAMVVLSRIPPDFWLKWAWPLYGISIALLLSVLLFGQSVNGAKRWINIAGLQFQPSEIAKFTLIVLFARLTKGFGSSARQFRYGVLGFGGALLGILVPRTVTMVANVQNASEHVQELSESAPYGGIPVCCLLSAG